MEQFAVPEGLGDAVGEVESGHLFVADFGVEADHFGVVELVDEGDGVADGGQEDVAAGLVGFGFEGEPQVVALAADVFAQDVEGFAQAVERGGDVLGGFVFGAVHAAPAHVGAGAEFRGAVDVAHDLAQGVAAHVAAVGGEAAVAEDGVAEEVGSDHGDGHAALFERPGEAFDDGVAFRGGAVRREEVVVVEGDAVGAEFAEFPDDVDGVELRAYGLAEGVVAAPSHSPQSEAEPVLGCGLVVAHVGLFRCRFGFTVRVGFGLRRSVRVPAGWGRLR